MKKYYEYDNDEELLFMVEESNEEAQTELINKYSGLINYSLKKYNNLIEKIGLEEKDLYQEGLLGLLDAISLYDKEKNVQFNTFARKCVDNRIISNLRSANRNKHQLLNQSLSLDIGEDEQGMYDYTKTDEATIEEKMILKEQLNYVSKKLRETLTPMEYEVFTLKISGYKNDEIASELNKDKRSIENANNRIKNKLKEIKKDL